MNIKEVRKIVGGIKSQLFKNSNSYSIGMLKSHFKGTGLQFREHQVYSHGDDVRFIDWNMLAKTGNPFIKTFEEERNVEIVVVIDTNISMFNGYKGVSKLQAAFEICCLLYLLAEETGDHVHALIMSDEVINIPKKNGDEGIIALLAGLERAGVLKDDGSIDLNYPLEKASSNDKKEESRKRAVMRHLMYKREIVLLSDFNDFLEKSELQRILLRSNVHCFQLLSPIDLNKEIPFEIYARKSASNSKGQLISSASRGLKDLELDKKVKPLKVEERYLENFVKEMM